MSLRNTSALRAVCLAALALALLVWPSLAQQPPLKLTPTLNKPLSALEKLLGPPRHVGLEQERYYKVPGFVRVVVRPTPEKAPAVVTFQFAPGTVKSELEALARIGAPDAVLPPHWHSHWSAPGESKNDELTLSRLEESPATQAPAATPLTAPKNPTQKFTLTRHFLERMQERGVSEAEATEVMEKGRRFYDPKNDSYIRYKDGLYVALTKDGVLKTVVRGPIASRWKPL
ncbi:DUF4258 domain-containing protein [Armatimonas rosea]|uniref:Uncharacterized protein n=1 Tax=Armatimonas rosea TaxID=685828 RepID=A0A7W9SN33_ARMRO|nr:DUF4258 domain-containing protein [Armatimonas rosea]MBB6049670.1 hypothetical protein [Armatimonas rosea]